MAWMLLVVAGLLEVAWAIGLKYTEGFTRLWPSVLTVGAMALSMYLLGMAAKTLPIGTAYAVWVGIGAAGTAVLGIFVLGEPASAARVACLVLLVAAIAGLKVTGKEPGERGRGSEEGAGRAGAQATAAGRD
jgi:quaternary ammonium compound-resistance protein SugE